jgi:hypothetical protein
MNKLLLSLTAVLTLAFSSVKAQDGIEIRVDGVGADISGGTYSTSLFATSPDLVGGIFQVHFVVTNNTGSDQQWRITRKKLSVPATWVDQVCWPPLCYNANGDVYMTPHTGGNPAPVIVDGTDMTTNSEVAELKPRITPDQSGAGYASYRYYITTTSGIYLDSVDLNIGFVLGVNTVKQNPTVAVNPNPASDNVTISLGSIDNATVRIVDVLGNVVYTDAVSNGTTSIDVSGFKNGVYFVMIESPGIKAINRKLIVRH